MTVDGLRYSNDYKEIVNEIKGYPINFEFYLDYGNMSHSKENVLRFIIEELEELDIIKCIGVDIDLLSNSWIEKYRKI